MNLTKDSQKLICILYKSYLEKRKSGYSKSNANNFGSSHDIHKNLCSNWLFDDVDDTCRELSNIGLLNCMWADNIAYIVRISDQGIIYMENRFKNGLVGVIDFLTKFI